MTDTDKLVPYQPRSFPSIPGGEDQYFVNELKRIAQAVVSIEEALVKLEARLAAGSL